MSEHRVTVRWRRTSPDFTYESYNRDHDWVFAGVQVPASAAPAYRGTPERVDPEEAFVASLSSCHMLTFLALACKKRLTVDSYEDDAVGHLEKNAHGKLAVTRVILRPRIRFAGTSPTAEELAQLHDRAHHECFIANSVLTTVTVEPKE
jgi:organic hydroperoxide reductase OsmC/OhrA